MQWQSTTIRFFNVTSVTKQKAVDSTFPISSDDYIFSFYIENI